MKVGGGYLAITRPWPAMLRDDLGRRRALREDLLVAVAQGRLLPGRRRQARRRTVYFWLLGRVDDVMNVAGHRIGTMEVESALVDHYAVAEAAVVGVSDELKGTAIAAFVILKEKERLAAARSDGT